MAREVERKKWKGTEKKERNNKKKTVPYEENPVHLSMRKRNITTTGALFRSHRRKSAGIHHQCSKTTHPEEKSGSTSICILPSPAGLLYIAFRVSFLSYFLSALFLLALPLHSNPGSLSHSS